MTSVASITSSHWRCNLTVSDSVSVLLMTSRRRSLDAALPHLSFLFLTFSLLHREPHTHGLCQSCRQNLINSDLVSWYLFILMAYDPEFLFTAVI